MNTESLKETEGDNILRLLLYNGKQHLTKAQSLQSVV